MKCPVCGKENIDNNLYCYSCGARLSGKPPGSDKKKTLQLLLIAVLMGIQIREKIQIRGPNLSGLTVSLISFIIITVIPMGFIMQAV